MGTMVGVALVVVTGSVALRPDADTIASAAEGRPPDIARVVPVPGEPPPPDLVVPAEPELDVEVETLAPVPPEDDQSPGLITIVASTRTDAHGELVLTAWAAAPDQLCLSAPPMTADTGLCAPPPERGDALRLSGDWTDESREPPLTCVAALLPSDAVEFAVDGEALPLTDASLDGNDVTAVLACWDEVRDVGGWNVTFADGGGEGIAR
ncbi:MAG: hypothetical protein R3343_02245 [Nitriliruptorales bacterium]|nr:hypothetical protein [Nitriliruptorales bacterium]